MVCCTEGRVYQWSCMQLWTGACVDMLCSAVQCCAVLCCLTQVLTCSELMDCKVLQTLHVAACLTCIPMPWYGTPHQGFYRHRILGATRPGGNTTLGVLVSYHKLAFACSKPHEALCSRYTDQSVGWTRCSSTGLATRHLWYLQS